MRACLYAGVPVCGCACMRRRCGGRTRPGGGQGAPHRFCSSCGTWRAPAPPSALSVCACLPRGLCRASVSGPAGRSAHARVLRPRACDTRRSHPAPHSCQTRPPSAAALGPRASIKQQKSTASVGSTVCKCDSFLCSPPGDNHDKETSRDRVQHGSVCSCPHQKNRKIKENVRARA